MDELKELKEALKEGLRVIVLAVIPVLLFSVENGEFNWRVVGVTALVAFLRFVDSWLHREGKAAGDKALAGGLTRF